MTKIASVIEKDQHLCNCGVIALLTMEFLCLREKILLL